MLAFFLSGWWHFFFLPHGAPWYEGNVWGNVVAIIPCGILAFIAGERGLKAIHRKLNHHLMLTEELHHLAHTGQVHPRVQARLDAGQSHTPNLQ